MAQATLFFDYDGTLHDSMRLYGPAFRSTYDWLVEQGFACPAEFSDAQVASWLGWTVEDMWTTFIPGIPEPIWREAAARVGAHMDEGLHAGCGALFDGVPEMLASLKKEGFSLVFLSNCGRSYRDTHLEIFGIDQLFDAAYCAQDFDYCPKWQVYQEVRSNHPGQHLMVGDRFHDMEVATRAGIPSIGCSYGFGKPGELDMANAIVQAPEDIPAQALKLLKL